MHKLEKICNLISYKHNEDLKKMKELLQLGLFSLQIVCKNLTKKHLKLLSTPGVAEVCLKIQNQLSLINGLSIRGRSIAIVSRGSFLGCSGKQCMPAMDWLIAQMKFYANIDCYPFVIRPHCSLASVLSDLANTYCGVLYLDEQQLPLITASVNFFVLSHPEVCQVVQCQLTDAEASACVLAHLIQNQHDGLVSQYTIIQYLNYGPSRLNSFEARSLELELESDGNLTPLDLHQILKGKITLALRFKDILQIKSYFTLRNFKKLFSSNQLQQSVTQKLNAIVTDGTAILGLGNIGPIPGLPVMQAKSMMFKHLGNVEVVPICINPRETPAKTIEAILDLVYFFKAINLQDFKSPECFSIERKLQSLNIMPVFHDDQHGTAVATLGGFINAAKLTEKVPRQCKVVINGAGAAGINIALIIHGYGVRNIIVCDRAGIIYKGRKQNMNEFKQEIADITNHQLETGRLQDAIQNADVFIGVSTKDTFKKEWIKKMNSKPIIFALANPDPQITKEEAMEGGAFIYGSGRSGEPNQISNSLVYPGIFKAIKEHNISKVTHKMKLMAAEQIANTMEQNISICQILPSCLNRKVSERISSRLGQNQ